MNVEPVQNNLESMLNNMTIKQNHFYSLSNQQNTSDIEYRRIADELQKLGKHIYRRKISILFPHTSKRFQHIIKFNLNASDDAG